VAWFGLGGDPSTLFVASGTIGTLIRSSSTRSPRRRGRCCSSRAREVRVAEVVIPVLALGLIGYTLFRHVSPYPEGASALYPAVSAAWVVVGVLVVLLRPAAARRAGDELTASEGLTDESRSRNRSVP
jgi:hypothetical protein